jgi:hypothetical protein
VRKLYDSLMLMVFDSPDYTNIEIPYEVMSRHDLSVHTIAGDGPVGASSWVDFEFVPEDDFHVWTILGIQVTFLRPQAIMAFVDHNSARVGLLFGEDTLQFEYINGIAMRVAYGDTLHVHVYNTDANTQTAYVTVNAYKERA